MEKQYLRDLIENHTKDEVIDYYITTNHSFMESVEHFNTTKKVLARYLRKFSIRKPKHLVSKLSHKKQIITHPGARRQLEQRITEDEFRNYYIVENHSMIDTAKHFGTTETGVVDYIKVHNIHKDYKTTLKLSARTMMKKYGHEHNSQIESVKKSKAKNVYKYIYKDDTFDSSWELAYHIYNEDHNISSTRCYETFKYTYNDKICHYTPDFIVDGKYIEIKGDYMLNGDVFANIYSSDIEEKSTAKLECMKSIGVVILRQNDIQAELKYCQQKFNDKY